MRFRVLVPLVVAVAGLTVAGAPAQAEEGSAPGGAVEGKVSHCIGNVTTPKAEVRCFDSFTEAISTATGGRVADAPADAGKAATNKAFEAELRSLSKAAAEPGVQVQNVLEIDYDYHFFGTDTFTWWVENDSCWGNPIGAVKWQVWNLDDYGWNDRINAYGNHNFCYSAHFEHAGFQGLAMGWDTGSGGMGSLDGEASSIQWS
ncbi:hypothetical protein BLA60_29940 [Actinophytocola xinjiangensis]|uniref:Peptidase inhibitor family I36 n=1 Tax=Actinophytocola xinjiangensis TaxID=485602 RepID=A0A7Z0WHR8_9PSEU|nr:hypothetical protein [Actinophytocola xinjiangensis]OLF06780.1 hypothetical protein BLA60_29940 [Actinophytocola xinjiangensis]